MSKNPKGNRWLLVAAGAIVAVAVATAVFTRHQWLPLLRDAGQPDGHAGAAASGDAHEGHDHAPEGHSEGASIELSERGLKNIGFEPFAVAPADYARRLTLPAIVVERPGKSQVHITAPLTGIVEKIFVAPGEAIGADELLFQVRLTHEELVAAQREFLETHANLGVVEREISRLKGLGEGVVAGKRILEQEYEQDRLEVALDAAQQAMLLHGLTDEQIAEVRKSGRLFRQITIRAPQHSDAEEACDAPHLFTIQSLSVALGEHVEVGREMAMLSDHCELLIEVRAFEDDAAPIRRASELNLAVTATQLDRSSSEGPPTNLEILYVAGQIEPESRAFKAYVRLPNRIAMDKNVAGKRFLEWAYKPGQRMELSVPVETWEDQIVVPTTAVVDEGAEAYVYRQNGEHFDQVPVHIRYRDQAAVVIANDGAIFQGDVIAGRGAYQMHLALKNKSGGGVDPHAGHNH